MKLIVLLTTVLVAATAWAADEKPYDYRISEAYRKLSDLDRQRLEQVRRDQVLLWGALDMYADQHNGNPPATLDELAPMYLTELPTDPFAVPPSDTKQEIGSYTRSKEGSGYRYQRGAPGTRAWALASVGLPNFPYLAERGNVGLYICKGTWISGINPVIGPLFKVELGNASNQTQTLGVKNGVQTETSHLQEAIQSGFEDVRALSAMLPGQVYTVQVNGMNETGPGDLFLRRRHAGEIRTSKLSCGCGDNALVFLDRMERSGFEALLVDSAEISSRSLFNHFSGHVVVAVRDPKNTADPHWRLVDPTNLKVLSDCWSREEPSFEAFGRLFWIGYCGSVAQYPAHSPEELKQFYTATLAKAPRAVLSAALIQLKFIIDSSLRTSDQSYLNPHLTEFIRLQERLFQVYAIQPSKTVTILLQRGGDDGRTTLDFSETEGWIARLGIKSACSISLLDYFEQKVSEHFRKAN